MPRSIYFARLSLYRSAQDPASTPPVAAVDPFSTLLRRAGQWPGITVFEREAAAATDPAGSGPAAAGCVRCGRSLQFRCALPPSLQHAQALLLERDANGAVTLLSHPALLDGAVWYQRAVEVPRTDATPHGGGAVGKIHLLVPGHSDLLLVCCRNRSVRFDRLAMFRRSEAERRIGPLSFPALEATDLRELADTVLELPPEDWAVIAGMVEVAPDTLQAETGLQPSRCSFQDATGRAPSRPSKPLPAGQENSVMPLIPIPDPVKSLLAHQKQLVRQWAASANVTPVDEARYFRQDWPPLNSLEWRLTVATNSGLFIEGHNRHPARAGILKMQGRIAHSVHCLSYARNHAGRRAPGRWVTDGDPIVKNGRRAPSYLDHYVDGYEPEPMSIPKVDVAMIAHCFRTPVEVWELHDDDQFAYWLQQATADYDLFSFGGLAIPDNSLRVTDLGPAPTTPVAKAGGGVQEVEHPPVPAWRFLRFSVTLPQAFQTAQVMLFEDDGTAVTLVSSNAQTDYNLVYTNGLFQTPRIRADPPPLPSMWFNPCLRSEFITLIVADDAPLRLDQLAFFRNGDVRTVQTLDCEQIADLRRRLFALPRDKWCMLKKVVSVVPPHAP